MAVLWDRMVFSFSSNSWKMVGLRDFLGSARGQVSVSSCASSRLDVEMNAPAGGM